MKGLLKKLPPEQQDWNIFLESKIISEERVKYGACINVGRDFGAVAEFIVHSWNSYIVFLLEDEVMLLKDYEWSGRLSEDKALLNGVIDFGGVLVSYFGRFDDRDTGFVCVGDASHIKRIHKRR